MEDQPKEKLRDNGGRRSGFDRRQFNYSAHIPEKRNNPDRRSGMDRRSGRDRRSGEDRRQGGSYSPELERRKAFVIRARNMAQVKGRSGGGH